MDATITVASQSMPTWAQPTFIGCVIFFVAGVILALTTKRGVSARRVNAGITIMILSALALAYAVMRAGLSMEAANEMAIAREAEAAEPQASDARTRRPARRNRSRKDHGGDNTNRPCHAEEGPSVRCRTCIAQNHKETRNG